MRFPDCLLSNIRPLIALYGSTELHERFISSSPHINFLSIDDEWNHPAPLTKPNPETTHSKSPHILPSTWLYDLIHSLPSCIALLFSLSTPSTEVTQSITHFATSVSSHSVRIVLILTSDGSHLRDSFIEARKCYEKLLPKSHLLLLDVAANSSIDYTRDALLNIAKHYYEDEIAAIKSYKSKNQVNLPNNVLVGFEFKRAVLNSIILDKKESDFRYSKCLDAINSSSTITLETVFVRTVTVLRLLSSKLLLGDYVSFVALIRDHLDWGKSTKSGLIKESIRMLLKTETLTSYDCSHNKILSKLVSLRTLTLFKHLFSCFCFEISQMLSSSSTKPSKTHTTSSISKRRLQSFHYVLLAADYCSKRDALSRAFLKEVNQSQVDHIIIKSIDDVRQSFITDEPAVGQHYVISALNPLDHHIIPPDSLSSLPSTIELLTMARSSLSSKPGMKRVEMKVIFDVVVEISAIIDPSEEVLGKAVDIGIDYLIPFWCSNSNSCFYSVIGHVFWTLISLFVKYLSLKVTDEQGSLTRVDDVRQAGAKLLVYLGSDRFLAFRKAVSLSQENFDLYYSIFDTPGHQFISLSPVFSPFSLELTNTCKNEIVFPTKLAFYVSLQCCSGFPFGLSRAGLIVFLKGQNNIYQVNIGQKELIDFCLIDSVGLFQAENKVTINHSNPSVSESSIKHLCPVQINPNDCNQPIRVIQVYLILSNSLYSIVNLVQHPIQFLIHNTPIKANFELNRVFPLDEDLFADYACLFELKLFSLGHTLPNSTLIIDFHGQNFKAVLKDDLTDVSDELASVNELSYRKLTLSNLSVSPGRNQSLYLNLMSTVEQEISFEVKLVFDPSNPHIFASRQYSFRFIDPIKVALSEHRTNFEVTLRNRSSYSFDVNFPLLQLNERIPSKKTTNLVITDLDNDCTRLEYFLKLSSIPRFLPSWFSQLISKELQGSLDVVRKNPDTNSIISVDFKFDKVVSLFSVNQMAINLQCSIQSIDCLISVQKTKEFLLSGPSKVSLSLKKGEDYQLVLHFVPLATGFLQFPRISFTNSRNHSAKLTSTRVCSMFVTG
ncbi:hypothetical protein P9112_003214 [Eukaryota sp. TZLM1-RC]